MRPGLAMSIDVEDWFQVENLKPAIPRETWDRRSLRVETNTRRMLAMLDEHDAQATFFVLGWVARRCPQLVREITAAGHELASHGYGHELVSRQTPDTFRADVIRAKGLLEDISGVEVRGYRAPSFSITDWAIPILQDTGHRYDSSCFPAPHPRYGRLSGVTGPACELRPGFVEVCVSSLRAGPLNLPMGGGGYFRLLPGCVFEQGVRRVLKQAGSYVFYLHPWEIDPDQPRVSGLGVLAKWRHYVNLGKAEARWRRLLGRHRWRTVGEMALAVSGPRKKTISRDNTQMAA